MPESKSAARAADDDIRKAIEIMDSRNSWSLARALAAHLLVMGKSERESNIKDVHEIKR